MRGFPPGPRSVSLVGALCFSRGKQRFSVAEKSSKMIMRFSAGIPGALKPWWLAAYQAVRDFSAAC